MDCVEVLLKLLLRPSNSAITKYTVWESLWAVEPLCSRDKDMRRSFVLQTVQERFYLWLSKFRDMCGFLAKVNRLTSL
jgi:hypothetical protein